MDQHENNQQNGESDELPEESLGDVSTGTVNWNDIPDPTHRLHPQRKLGHS